MLAWRFLDPAGTEVGRSESFSDRGAAETWMAASWPELLERGIEEVALLDEADGELYRMALSGSGNT